MTAAQYGNILANPAAQYNGNVGGNPDLDPEESDTYSFGIVLTPAFLPGFSLTVDYYDIKVEKLINSVGADFILGQCLDRATATFCDRVHRVPLNGSIWLGDDGLRRRSDPQHRLAADQGLRCRGELSLRHRQRRPARAELIGTYVDEFLIEPLPGAPKYDCAGLFGTVCGTPIPDWRHKLRANWPTPWGWICR